MTVHQDLTVIDEFVTILPTMHESAQQAVERQLAFVGAINRLVDATFVEGIHYATIPGTNKPTLMLPGIEMARGLLGVREEFIDLHTIRDLNPDNPFVYYEVECVLIHIHSGLEIGRGQAICHTREKSFMRQQSRKCPNCGEEAIIKGKAEFGGGWLCWNKRGGCGAKFQDGDTAIEGQTIGMVSDPQLVWDGLNRARKIANKRAKADAIKNAAMLSEKFTVDLEDEIPVASTPKPSNGTPDIHWTGIPLQVKSFYDHCKGLALPPAGKDQIMEALDVDKISDYSGSMADAILTVNEHMEDIARKEGDAPDVDQETFDKLIMELWNDDDVRKHYSNTPHIRNTLDKYEGDVMGVGYETVKAWMLDRKKSVYTSADTDKTSMDEIPF